MDARPVVDAGGLANFHPQVARCYCAADVDALVSEGRTLIRSNPTLLELLADFAPASDTTTANERGGRTAD